MDIITHGRRSTAGKTTPGKTNWQPYQSDKGIYVDIDTSSGRFSGIPVYTASIGGNSRHWATIGVTAIYNPSATKFRVYIRWADGSPLTPETANELQWHINWIGTEIPKPL